jgi:hypothetical protein
LPSASRADHLHWSAAVVLAAALLGLSACGGGKSSAPATKAASAPKLHDAISAPDAKMLKRGETLTVPKQTLQTVGWQVSCTGDGRRLNAEAIPGQRTGTGKIVAYGSGTPAIWVRHNADGSITIQCR